MRLMKIILVTLLLALSGCPESEYSRRQSVRAHDLREIEKARLRVEKLKLQIEESKLKAELKSLWGTK